MPIQPHDDGDPLAPHSASAAELKMLLEAEGVGRPFLAFRDRLGLLCLFVVPQGDGTSSVGRRVEMDLSIPWDREVSGLHAELQVIGGELAIVDDGLSTNGTYLNAKRINGRQRLRDGDRIRVGRTVLAYRTPAAETVHETISAMDSPALMELTDTQRRVLIALCRPFRDGAGFASPATNQQIASEVFLSVDTVKTHLRILFAKFELSELAQNEKRSRLAEYVLQFGIISQRDLS
jgi:FHA domain/Bacterial regulatory proteins, luxR family